MNCRRVSRICVCINLIDFSKTESKNAKNHKNKVHTHIHIISIFIKALLSFYRRRTAYCANYYERGLYILCLSLSGMLFFYRHAFLAVTFIHVHNMYMYMYMYIFVYMYPQPNSLTYSNFFIPCFYSMQKAHRVH